MSSNERVARERAQLFRAEHGLGTRPLGDLFELAHTALDVDALSIDADQAEHGLSMLDPATGRVAIAVATTPHPMRQRSTLAHEFGHVIGGDLEAPPQQPPAPSARTPTEIQADAFARHLLLPLQALSDRFGSGRPGTVAGGRVGLSELAAVIQEFEVSPFLAAIQLKEAGLIDPETQEQWASLSAGSLAVRYGWFSQYQVLAASSARPRAPQTLMRRAVEGYRRGVIGIEELASWYGQRPEQLLEKLGPPERDVDVDEDVDEDQPLFPPGFLASRPTAS